MIKEMLAWLFAAGLNTSVPSMLGDDAFKDAEITGEVRAGVKFFESPTQKVKTHKQVFWCKNQVQGHLLLFTLDGVVYTSKDHGFHWENVQDKLIKTAFIENFKSKGK